MNSFVVRTGCLSRCAGVLRQRTLRRSLRGCSAVLQTCVRCSSTVRLLRPCAPPCPTMTISRAGAIKKHVCDARCGFPSAGIDAYWCYSRLCMVTGSSADHATRHRCLLPCANCSRLAETSLCVNRLRSTASALQPNTSSGSCKNFCAHDNRHIIDRGSEHFKMARDFRSVGVRRNLYTSDVGAPKKNSRRSKKKRSVVHRSVEVSVSHASYVHV